MKARAACGIGGIAKRAAAGNLKGGGSVAYGACRQRARAQRDGSDGIIAVWAARKGVLP